MINSDCFVIRFMIKIMFVFIYVFKCWMWNMIYDMFVFFNGNIIIVIIMCNENRWKCFKFIWWDVVFWIGIISNINYIYLFVCVMCINVD